MEKRPQSVSKQRVDSVSRIDARTEQSYYNTTGINNRSLYDSRRNEAASLRLPKPPSRYEEHKVPEYQQQDSRYEYLRKDYVFASGGEES